MAVDNLRHTSAADTVEDIAGDIVADIEIDKTE